MTYLIINTLTVALISFNTRKYPISSEISVTLEFRTIFSGIARWTPRNIRVSRS